MAISPLPKTTATALASSQVVVDPASVVRELVANALDAGASFVFVEVSPDALDVIQVRDNGSGIATQDRSMVGQRHCTSKIRSLDDLSSLGGKSLGFRGEAMASILDMSEDVTVTTCVEGDLVGEVFHLNQRPRSSRYFVAMNHEEDTQYLQQPEDILSCWNNGPRFESTCKASCPEAKPGEEVDQKLGKHQEDVAGVLFFQALGQVFLESPQVSE